MKAQASLEMVVGLIILLVVAGVVISLVIHFINPERMPDPREKLSINDFLANCETYCEDHNSVDYCREYYSRGDWDKDGEKDELIKVGKHDWVTCEDRIYCFLVKPCERFGSGGLDTMDKCKRVLCQTYMEKLGDEEDSSAAIKDALQLHTSKCSFSPSSLAANGFKESDAGWMELFDVLDTKPEACS